MKNKIPSLFFNYDANLTLVIAMELKFFFLVMLVYLYDVLAVTSSMLKTSVKFLGISFKFWLGPCYLSFLTA